jgi:hypothetical protein
MSLLVSGVVLVLLSNGSIVLSGVTGLMVWPMMSTRLATGGCERAE